MPYRPISPDAPRAPGRPEPEGLTDISLPMSGIAVASAPDAGAGEDGGRSVAACWAGRLIRIVLAVYLLPALAVVLIVGGIGMLVLGAVRMVPRVVEGLAGWPRTPIGPGPLS